MATQTEIIKDHLIKYGTITGVQAAAMFKARCLPKRISELRQQGLNIISEWKKDTTGQRYVKYHYRGIA